MVCLTLRAEGQRLHLIVDRHGVRRSEERPKGLPADGFIRRLRNLVGNALAEVEGHGPRRRIRLETRSDTLFMAYEQGVVLRDSAGKVRAARRRLDGRAPDDGWSAVPLDALSAYVRETPDEIRLAEKRLKGALARVARTRRKVTQEATRVQDAAALRHEADLLMAHAHLRPTGTRLVVRDWSGARLELELGLHEGRARSAAEAAEWRYKRAKRYERGRAITEARLAELAASEDALHRARRRLDAGEDAEAVLASVGLRLPVQNRKAAQARLPYREFALGETRVLVGRSARDNDELTLRIARPHDHWLHVRGRPGSHVVVRLNKGAVPSSEVLTSAAILAAHFSTASGEDRVDVMHVARRYVRKPRGAAPGSVQVERERVLQVRHDPERIRSLLSKELR